MRDACAAIIITSVLLAAAPPAWGIDPVPPALDSPLGPGAYLQFVHPDGGRTYCTGNFVWNDTAGGLYLGTAGHCVLAGNSSTGGFPEVPQVDLSGIRTFVFPERCGLHIVQIDCADLEDKAIELGPIASAVDLPAVGHDFALITIPDALASHVSFGLPDWGEAVRSDPASAGDILGVFGNGVGPGEVSRHRVGAAIGSYEDVDLWSTVFPAGYDHSRVWAGEIPVFFGDSGGPVVTLRMGPDGPVTDSAVGIVTTIVLTPHFVVGPTIALAKDLAGQGGIQVELVLDAPEGA